MYFLKKFKLNNLASMVMFSGSFFRAKTSHFLYEQIFKTYSPLFQYLLAYFTVLMRSLQIAIGDLTQLTHKTGRCAPPIPPIGASLILPAKNPSIKSAEPSCFLG